MPAYYELQEVLSQRLEEEVPRNHLDLRHRLDEASKEQHSWVLLS